MIIAIEGASASGKTTWCRGQLPELCVPETPENIAAPDLYDDPAEVGRFWVNHAIANWQRALEIERKRGIAVCDSDPFHLYLAWALWKSGALDRGLFDIESEFYRAAFAQKQIGFVDLVLWIEAPQDELRRRAKADGRRRRKRHEMYLALVPWMKKWFAARERILPRTVQPLTALVRLEELTRSSLPQRYDVAALDAMLQQIEA